MKWREKGSQSELCVVEKDYPVEAEVGVAKLSAKVGVRRGQQLETPKEHALETMQDRLKQERWRCDS